MIKDQKGITLVEVLTAIALLSIIILLSSSIHIFGQKQYQNQSKEVQVQANERLAMNILTKEIRKAQKIEVVSPKILKVNDSDIYKHEGTTLKKGNQNLVSGIHNFVVTKEGNRIKLTLGNMPETTIFLRE